MRFSKPLIGADGAEGETPTIPPIACRGLYRVYGEQSNSDELSVKVERRIVVSPP